MEVIFFKSPVELREWLEENHDKATELYVGFYKKSSGHIGITYPQALDEALSFGWIDGVRRSIDDTSYTIRFTPRKPRSIWSLVNIKRANELADLGLMGPPGLKAFNERDKSRSKLYSYEREVAELGDAYEKRFRANKKAWDFFQAQPPSYRKTATWWAMSARREESRLNRLAALIESTEKGQRLPAIVGGSNTKQKGKE
jgi:uncharacterized protein YdeI (YjbR/CyaY-like superfamily)